MKKFAICLKQKRTNNNFTQQQMADLLNISGIPKDMKGIGKNHREPD